MNWLLDGYRLYEREGLKNTAEMDALVREYRWDNDLIGQYMAERITLTPDCPRNRIPLKRVLTEYRWWCEEMDAKPLSMKNFKAELIKRDVKVYECQHVVSVDAKMEFDYSAAV